MSARPRRAEPLPALFAAVLWAALAFAFDGMLSVALDRDLLGADAAPGLGVLSFAVTGIAVWVALAVGAAQRAPWWGIVLAACAAYLAPVALAAATAGLALTAEQALSPFVLGGAGIAAAVALATWAVVRRERLAAGSDAPRSRV